jgi:hypothetical protein
VVLAIAAATNAAYVQLFGDEFVNFYDTIYVNHARPLAVRDEPGAYYAVNPLLHVVNSCYLPPRSE